MLWIALHLPQLPLQALLASKPGLEASLPLAVADPRQLLVSNRAAKALGVQAGQSVATALAVAPGLVVLARNQGQEAAFVESLALTLGVLTPRLQLCRSGVLLEVQASLRLFGGVRRMLRQAKALTQGLGAHARLACAPSAGAAWLLATSGRAQRHALKPRTCTRRLDPLPAMALQALMPITVRQAELLEALGLQDLSALRALPRAGLRQRLGPEMALALDRAYGDAPPGHAWFEPPERFAIKRELIHRADSAEVLVGAVEALLPALRGWLQLRWEAATVMDLRLCHDHGRDPLPDTVLRLQLSVASRDMAQIARLWRERLQRHVLAAPVYALGLSLEGSVPHSGTPGELIPRAGQDEADHAALLDRLIARLGPERVQRWRPVADHRPDRAQQALPAQLSVRETDPWAGDSLASPHAGGGPTRPAWLLNPPLPLASDAMGRPLHGGALRLCSRAERIEVGWFDGQTVRRDYRVAEGSDHRLRWIFRERRPGQDNEAWFLQGWFG
jgi:protein ImuB